MGSFPARKGSIFENLRETSAILAHFEPEGPHFMQITLVIQPAWPVLPGTPPRPGPHLFAPHLSPAPPENHYKSSSGLVISPRMARATCV